MMGFRDMSGCVVVVMGVRASGGGGDRWGQEVVDRYFGDSQMHQLTAAAGKSGEKKPPTVRAKRTDAVCAAGRVECRPPVADVLMGNARATTSKAKKAAPSPKKPWAKTDGAEVKPEATAVVEKGPSGRRPKQSHPN